MEIEILRNTLTGLKKCKGELFEYGGLQFCITHFCGEYHAIELHTGCDAATGKTKKTVKREIENRDLEKYKEALEKTIKYYGIKEPINKRINNK